MLAVDTLVQNRYLIKKLIGRGGMGAVYLAEDRRFNNRMVAVKEMLFTNNPKLEAAFGREANLLAQLSHRGLPKVSDYFNDQGFQYLVMEYVPGDDLETLLKKVGGPFPYKRVLKWADSLLDILEYLHSQNPQVIHRDIKPQNLKLTADDKIILLDFGLAKDMVANMSQMASANSLVGFTPNYAPLEQLEGNQATTQTDLYLFSATIYHLLTNTLPASSLNRVQAKIDERSDPLYPAHQLNHEVPAKFSALLSHGLNLKLEQRPLSATEMRRYLQELMNEPASVANAPTEQMNLQNKAPEQRNIQTAVFPLKAEDYLTDSQDFQTQPQEIQPKLQDFQTNPQTVPTPPQNFPTQLPPQSMQTQLPPQNNQVKQESVQTIAFTPVQENPQTVAYIPPPTPAATMMAGGQSFAPQNSQPGFVPQNSQPILSTPTKSGRGMFLPLLVGLILLLGVGGVGAYFVAQKFLPTTDTTIKNSVEPKTVNNPEKKNDAATGSMDAGLSNANANANTSEETVKQESVKTPDKKVVETKVVQQQKPVVTQKVQKPTVQKPIKTVRQTQRPTGGGGSEIDQ